MAVLLFDRRSRASMAAHALFATAANEHASQLNASGGLRLARVDLQGNPALAGCCWGRSQVEPGLEVRAWCHCFKQS